MTVKDLIKELKKLNPEMTVFLDSWDGYDKIHSIVTKTETNNVNSELEAVYIIGQSNH